MQLTPSFRVLLQQFRPVFTAPSFRLFVLILTGWALSSRHRFITECIFTAGQVGIGHWSCYHRFFSHYCWSLDSLSQALTQLLIRRFAPDGPILLAADDTLCRKRGLGLFGAGMHHDPLFSSKALKVFSWGHDWVVLALLLRLPRWAPTKVFALPLVFRLYVNRQGLAKGKKAKKAKSQRPQGKRGAAASAKKKKKWRPANPNHRTRPQLLVEMLQLVASWFPERQFVVCADSAYGGQSVLRHLPANVDLISQVHPQGVLYAPPPPPTGQRGRRRKKGDRLPDLQAWANDTGSSWQTLDFAQYGLHATLQIKVQQALYYKAGKERLLTIILTRDTTGQRPDHRFYCTRLDWSAPEVLSAYASRWALEVTFEGAKQVLGLEDPANRLPKAVQRTAPVALVLYSLIVLWFDAIGHEWVRVPYRPWYQRKREPSFQDMVTTLRRKSWEEKIAEVVSPTGPHGKWLASVVEWAARVG
jgi:DDE superfamily endonuclease